MGLPEILAVVMVVALCAVLMAGYPVALTLGGISLGFAAIGHALGVMNVAFLGALPQRVFGVMTNEVLLAIPLFIFMGVMLERSGIAEELLETMGRLFGSLRGGLAISAAIVGTLLAAAKGVVGATAVTMGLITLPAMVRHGYDPPESVSIADLFAAAIVPGLALVGLYILYLIGMAVFRPESAPAVPPQAGAPTGLRLARRLIEVLVAPVLLILIVLGSILGGLATPTESASLGAVGAMVLALVRNRSRTGFRSTVLVPVMRKTTQIAAMIFTILIGATFFSLVFRGLGGDDMVHRALVHLPGGATGAIVAVMIAMFLLGFVMDAFEIIFVVVPIVAPALLQMEGVDPVWLGIMMAVNLQTSYMHPPLGPTLFYLRGVAPPEITTRHIYVGIIPFVLIQLAFLVVLWFVPALATWLPRALYGG